MALHEESPAQIGKIRLNRRQSENIILTLFFCGLIFLFYPLTVLTIPKISLIYAIRLLTIQSVAALCLILMLIYYCKSLSELKRIPLALISAACPLFISFMHFYNNENYTLNSFLEASSFYIILFCGFVFRKELLNILPTTMTCFWILNMYHCVINLYFHQQIAGLPGNRNWHASWLAISSVFLLNIIYRWKSESPIFNFGKWLSMSAVLITSGYIIYLCESRGTVLGILSILFLFAFEETPQKLKKTFILITGTAVLLVSLGICFKTDRLAKLIAEDVRIPLWQTTSKLIMEKALA